jgi:hypothetical protein
VEEGAENLLSGTNYLSGPISSRNHREHVLGTSPKHPLDNFAVERVHARSEQPNLELVRTRFRLRKLQKFQLRTKARRSNRPHADPPNE